MGVAQELHGRYMGDEREMHGRYTGDAREMHGRYRGDMRLLATPDQGVDVRVRVLALTLTLILAPTLTIRRERLAEHVDGPEVDGQVGAERGARGAQGCPKRGLHV